MSLADELLADLEDDNDDGELEELIKVKVESEDEGKCLISFPFEYFSMFSLRNPRGAGR